MIQIERRKLDRRQVMASQAMAAIDHRCPAEVGAEKVLVILTSGSEDGGKRATLAFSAACSGLAVDKKVSLFLVGDGAFFADKSNCENMVTPGFPPLEALIESFIDLGGELTICSTCAGEGAVCGIDEAKKMAALQLRAEIKVRGFTSLIDDAQGATILTF